jgi:hypothetical protein
MEYTSFVKRDGVWEEGPGGARLPKSPFKGIGQAMNTRGAIAIVDTGGFYVTSYPGIGAEAQEAAKRVGMYNLRIVPLSPFPQELHAPDVRPVAPRREP